MKLSLLLTWLPALVSAANEGASLRRLDVGGGYIPPTPRPTPHPTPEPTPRPTMSPTPRPTGSPTARPTSSPTRAPTPRPTPSPTVYVPPTNSPTRRPTPSPTPRPTRMPTPRPTPVPTISMSPTDMPTSSPTKFPTKNPTTNPSASPTVSMAPSVSLAPTINEGPPCKEGEYDLCVDTMYNIRCSVAEIEGDCPGPFEYIITEADGTESLREYSLVNWLPKCLEAFGCDKHYYKEDDEDAFYDEKISAYKSYKSSHDPHYFVQVKMSSNQKYQYYCETIDQANKILAFEALLDDKYANEVGEPFECPDPTISPSAAPSPVPTTPLPTQSAAPTMAEGPPCEEGEYDLCVDTMYNIKCSVAEIEGDCPGPFEYIITEADGTESLREYSLVNWLPKCLEAFGCDKHYYKEDDEDAFYDEKISAYKSYKSSHDPHYFVQVKMSNNQKYQYYCETIDQANKILAFEALLDDKYANEVGEPFECPDPTISPSAAPSPVPTTPLPTQSAAPTMAEGPPCEEGEYDLCVDTMYNIKCSVAEIEGDCPGPFEYIITEADGTESLREYSLVNWLPKCLEAFGCDKYYYKEDDEDAFYDDKISAYKSYKSSHDPHYFVQVKMSSNQKYQYYCETEEQASKILAFEALLDDKYANEVGEPFACPDPTAAPTGVPSSYPTEETASPTACADSYFYNPPLYILVVLDISYSTYITDFTDDGQGIGDVNFDGVEDTVLDAEVQATMALLNTVLETEGLDNSNINIGLVTFETTAKYHGNFNPLNNDNTAINPTLEKYLKKPWTLDNSNDVIGLNQGYTNMDDALDKGIEYFSDATRPVFSGATNLMVFLGDGKPNVRGDGDDEEWCPGDDMDCSGAPANVVDPSAPAWEQGALSYCYSGDTGCWSSPYVYCARGYNGTAGSTTDCIDQEVTKSFDSELAEMDRLDVVRLAIGVGTASDTSVDSALWRIDNSPSKEILGLEPRTVLNANDLIDALKELCPYNTPNPTDSPSATPTNYPSFSPSLSPTGSPTGGPTPSPTSGPTAVPTSLPTSGPTASPTEYPTSGPTASPTSGPTAVPTAGPTGGPTSSPTGGPTSSPTMAPTAVPTSGPTSGPTSSPTGSPTAGPTTAPTAGPTGMPTAGPTGGPTAVPTSSPTGGPTSGPTAVPTSSPTGGPTSGPTAAPTSGPTVGPTSSPTGGPTGVPTSGPTAAPTSSPTGGPTGGPTSIPTAAPTSGPTALPTSGPTSSPTGSPTTGPTAVPTSGPTAIPTAAPTGGPTGGPTVVPTSSPTSGPTSSPTGSPTSGPTGGPTSTPSVGPTAVPTVDICDYNEIDFSVEMDTNKTAEDGMVAFPGQWDAYGIKITATPNSESGAASSTVPSRFYDTDSEAGMALIVPSLTETGSYVMNPYGGSLDITLDMTYDKTMVIELIDIADGGVITFEDESGEIMDEVPIASGTGEIQSIPVSVDGVRVVSITFSGTGALAQLNVCRNPLKTPAPVGLAPPSEPAFTREPTSAPTNVATSEPTSAPVVAVCPDDIKLVSVVGATEYDDLPVTIVARNASTVTIEISSPFRETVAWIFPQYIAGHTEECIGFDTFDSTRVERITAECMATAPITIVDVFALDGEILNSELDVANLPECCHGPDGIPTVQYTFKVYCVPQCPE